MNNSTRELLAYFTAEHLTQIKCPYDNVCPTVRDAFGIGIAATSVFGLMGNLISGIVLCMPQMRSAYALLLTALTISDSAQLSIHLIFTGLPSMGIDLIDRHSNFEFAKSLWMVGFVALTCSSYLTVLLSVERYIAVCHPFKALRLFPSKRRTFVYTLIILGMTFLFNLPKWFEKVLKSNPNPICTEYLNFTSSLKEAEYREILNTDGLEVNTTTCMCVNKSDLAKDTFYNIGYVVAGNMLVNFFIPLIILIILNTIIYREIIQSIQNRPSMTTSQKQDISITTMLICVVAIFCVCNMVFSIDKILEGIRAGSFTGCVGVAFKCLKNYLYTFNAAINFVVYCVCGSKFRQQLKRLWSLQSKPKHKHTLTTDNTRYYV